MLWLSNHDLFRLRLRGWRVAGADTAEWPESWLDTWERYFRRAVLLLARQDGQRRMVRKAGEAVAAALRALERERRLRRYISLTEEPKHDAA